MAREDSLARERQLNNLIDEVRRQGEEIERLKRLLLGVDGARPRVLVPTAGSDVWWELVVEEAETGDGMAWLVMQEL